MVQPSLGVVSETFIRAHAELLPSEVSIVHGNPARIDGKPVLSSNLLGKVARKLERMAGGHSYDWQNTQSYVKAFRRVLPDVVLAEYGMTGTWIMDACQKLRIPFAVHFHGYDASVKSLLEEYRLRYQKMFQSASAIIAVSRAMEGRLLEMGASRDKLYLNSYGVDTSRFSGAIASANPPVFIAVGRFVEKKAPHLTLLAFADVFKQRPAARLRMIGEGPLLSICKDLVKGLGISEAVTFLGAKNPETVLQEMRSARAFVQHSMVAADGDSEGTPVAVLEAGSCSLPVIATRHAGIPDAIVSGVTGLLVEERDVAGMAQAMIKLIDDPILADNLGKAAREKITSEYSSEKSIQKLYAILKSCVSNPEAI